MFPTRYLLYPPLPLALAFEVCLAGLVLTVAAPVDLMVLGLVLANCSYPYSIGLQLAD